MGYGGSCFPKDVKALIKTSESHGYQSTLLEQVDAINQQQRTLFLERILEHFDNDVRGRTFGIWGLSFKPRTDDLREAPSQTIIDGLLNRGARIRAFDPKGMPNAKRYFTIGFITRQMPMTPWMGGRHGALDRVERIPPSGL